MLLKFYVVTYTLEMELYAKNDGPMLCHYGVVVKAVNFQILEPENEGQGH